MLTFTDFRSKAACAEPATSERSAAGITRQSTSELLAIVEDLNGTPSVNTSAPTQAPVVFRMRESCGKLTASDPARAFMGDKLAMFDETDGRRPMLGERPLVCELRISCGVFLEATKLFSRRLCVV